MGMLPLLALSVLCTVGYCAAETSSSHRVTDYRHWYNDRYEYQNASHLRQRHAVKAKPANYYGSRIHRNDYAHSKLTSLDHDGYYNKKAYIQPDRNLVQPYATGIYRSHGKGQAIIPRPGATVAVINTASHPKAYKGTITARVLPAVETLNEVMPMRVISGKRRNCVGCPKNQAVVASKGNVEVILPKPCPFLRWISISGPQPGSRIPEGTHNIIGRVEHRGKICRYEFEVVVRRCGTFNMDRGRINCTADDAWGSTCMISCDEGFELVGSAELICQDNLKWSDNPPVCKKKIWCPLPQTPDDTKIWCQVDNESNLSEVKLPANTQCRFRSDGTQHLITCVDGYWVNKHGANRRNRNSKRRKQHRKLKNNRLNWEAVFPKTHVEIVHQDHQDP